MSLVLRFILSAMFFASSLFAGISCETNCKSFAKQNYLCPTVRNPRRICSTVNPAVYASCTSTKAVACEFLQKMGKKVIAEAVKVVSRDAFISREAKGWSTLTCASLGTAIISAVANGYALPICAALSAAVAGCSAFIWSSGTAITVGTCAALCETKNLNDCR